MVLSLSAVEGVKVLAALRTGCRGDTSPPEWELQSNFRLPQANLQKQNQIGDSERRRALAAALDSAGKVTAR